MWFIICKNGEKSKVDREDFETFSKFKWTYNHSAKGKFYVKGYPNGPKSQYLHRAILNYPKDMIVDHINGDTLDNRKSNLRICTQVENSRNSRKRKNKTSKFKGIYFNKANKNWRVQLSVNKKAKSLGSYKTEKEALEARNKYLKKYYDECSIKNLKEEG